MAASTSCSLAPDPGPATTARVFTPEFVIPSTDTHKPFWAQYDPYHETVFPWQHLVPVRSPSMSSVSSGPSVTGHSPGVDVRSLGTLPEPLSPSGRPAPVSSLYPTPHPADSRHYYGSSGTYSSNSSSSSLSRPQSGVPSHDDSHESQPLLGICETAIDGPYSDPEASGFGVKSGLDNAQNGVQSALVGQAIAHLIHPTWKVDYQDFAPEVTGFEDGNLRCRESFRYVLCSLKSLTLTHTQCSGY